jgi:hypothetical protein
MSETVTLGVPNYQFHVILPTPHIAQIIMNTAVCAQRTLHFCVMLTFWPIAYPDQLLATRQQYRRQTRQLYSVAEMRVS